MHKKTFLSIQQQERVSVAESSQTLANALALFSPRWRKRKTSSTATKYENLTNRC